MHTLHAPPHTPPRAKLHQLLALFQRFLHKKLGLHTLHAPPTPPPRAKLHQLLALFQRFLHKKLGLHTLHAPPTPPPTAKLHQLLALFQRFLHKKLGLHTLHAPPHTPPRAKLHQLLALFQRFPSSWGAFRAAALNPSDPHWVLAGSLLHSLVSEELGVIAEGSLLNKVFPSKKEYHNQLRLGLQCWTKRNGLPSMPQSDISDLCQKLWTEHSKQVTCHITKSSISQFQKTFEGAIFHCEDNFKQSSSLRIYCPCLYYQSIEQTFQDPSIFEPVPQDPTSIVSSLVETLQRKHGKSYHWAVGNGRQLPSGYILAKRKKDFRSGRPIISFVDSPFRPMLNILARLIFQLIPVACANHFASGDVYTLLTILKSAPVDADLILVNQDLAGFFTSIDQERFVGAWFMLLDFLRPHMNVSDNEAFSVYPGKTNNPGDIIKGRTFRRLNVTRKIIIQDVPDLIRSALQMQTFALGQKCLVEEAPWAALCPQPSASW